VIPKAKASAVSEAVATFDDGPSRLSQPRELVRGSPSTQGGEEKIEKRKKKKRKEKKKKKKRKKKRKKKKKRKQGKKGSTQTTSSEHCAVEPAG
jgi:hypothetical protein